MLPSGSRGHFCFTLNRGEAVPPFRRLAAAGERWLPMGRPGIAAFGGRESRRLAAETKGGKGTVWFPCPLLTPPNPPLDATPFGRASKRGLRGSVPGVFQLICS